MRAAARRGSVYLMTVGTSLIVSCIALAGLHSAGVLRRASRDSADADQARQLAWSGLEMARQSIDRNPNWRGQWQNGEPLRQQLGRGGISVSVTDPIDGQLTNNQQDPIHIRVTGERGNARESLAWTLGADDWLYPAANSAIYAESGIRFGPGRYTSNRWAYSPGRIESSHQSTVQINCLAAQGCNGGGFRWRAVHGGQWPMAVPNLSPDANDYIGRPYIEVGTPLSANDLPTGGVSLIANSHFESPQLLSGWTAYLANLSTVTNPVYSGARSARAVATHPNTLAGPYHPITSHLVNGHTYRLGMWVRSSDWQFITPRINAWVNGYGFGTTFSQFSYLIAPGQWRYIASEIRVSWGGRLDYAEVQLQSERNKEYFFDEVTLIDLDREAGSRYIEHTVLAPNLNPYRPEAPSPSGVYVLDAGGDRVVIRNARIHSTLVVRNSPQVELAEGVLWQPTTLHHPTLITDGNVRENISQSHLSEWVLGTNYNPPQAPLNGTSDTTFWGQFASTIEGPIAASGHIELNHIQQLTGPLLSGGRVTLNGSILNITTPSQIVSQPPPGMSHAQPSMRPIAGSLQPAL